MKPEAVALFFDRLAAALPDPKGELEYSDPFTLLVAVVLSAQATDVGVNKATRGLFAAADTPAGMLALGEETVRHHIRTIGLFNAKAKNVMALSRMLVDRHGGEVPHDREALEALPGVGRKTANVVMNIAFGAHTIAVDTHIFRIGNRTGIAPGRTPRAVEDALMRVVPPDRLQHAHHWLILHGRYVCKARRPECERCVVNDLCEWPEKTAGPKVIPEKASVRKTGTKQRPAGKVAAKKITAPKKVRAADGVPAAPRRVRSAPAETAPTPSPGPGRVRAR